MTSIAPLVGFVVALAARKLGHEQKVWRLLKPALAGCLIFAGYAIGKGSAEPTVLLDEPFVFGTGVVSWWVVMSAAWVFTFDAAEDKGIIGNKEAEHVEG